jgi:hypothetical protein
MLITPECPNTVKEVFTAGSEPIQTDNLYHRVQVNQETNYLATIFTPPDLIQEQVYMIPPPEAQAWALYAGLATPPDLYDPVPDNIPTWSDAAITSPVMFATVSGQVAIQGTAGGMDLDFFRLQVGQGLNPPKWLQIGENQTQATSDSQLEIWDTSGLEGLHAIQLLVVHQDQSIHRSTVMVTVDNQPPEVQILYPENDEMITVPTGERLILAADVHDDLSLDNVKIFIDDLLLSNFTQPPFVVSWIVKPGKHTLLVQATDKAGNTDQASIIFQVEME